MGTRPAAEGEVNGPCAGTKFLRFYTAHIPNSFMGPLGGEIGITVVLIYRTSPDATEQPAGALPTIEAPATVSGVPAPSLCLRPIAPSPAMTPHPIEARLAYAHCRAGNWHGIGELLAHWSLSHHDDI